jgi:hypothetical protein
MSRQKTSGKKYEAIIIARRRIRAIHLILGIVASFSLWVQSPPPHFNAFSRGAGWILIVFSIFGWAPYVISWIYSRPLLDDNAKAVVGFGVGASILTAIAAGFYQNIFAFQQKPPMIVISVSVTLCLIGLAKMCSAIWPLPRE